ncbi:MAG: transcription-repair coupling factor [Verrucomicrobiales bacterium]|nr:transcription-repair coupling factor [Verrucomicrobiales bacterium]MBV63498.1 transcription-repair coupling factor [Rickettsiales bacterium]|tara:strand:- start:70 stop:366 length:297 start_codon:yes stop_codon:yes gene_type:complete
MTHNVYFWLKENQNLEEFETMALKLTKIDIVESGSLGKNAPTPSREVTDKSFTYHLSLNFINLANHDLYQTHPEHKEFVTSCNQMWERVIVYDSETIN